MKRPSPPDTPARAVGRVLAGAVLISFAAVFVKLTSVPAVVSAFYRVGIGGRGRVGGAPGTGGVPAASHRFWRLPDGRSNWGQALYPGEG